MTTGASRTKLLVIGLDGATLDVLRPLAEEGVLPNIASFMAEGACGELESVMPPITGPAWASFMTGKNPGKHGVYEFLKKAPDGTDYPINSSDVHGRTLWELLSDAGRKVVVINVPVTYPPRKVDGVLLADFLTPSGRRDFGYPEGVVDELEGRYGPYRLYISEVYAPGKVGNVIDELFEVLEFRLSSARHLMETRPWDFFMVHVWGTDRLQHELWHILDTTHPKHDREEAARYRGRIMDYLRSVDGLIGELASLAGEGADVMVISDHGFGPIEKFMSFNVWLLDEGYLKLKKNPLTLMKLLLFRLGITPKLGYRLSMMLGFAKLRLSKGVGERVGMFRMINRFFLSLKDVDWSRSVAYSKGNYGQIFINVKGRELNGSVEPGEEYESVVRELSRRLKEITDPKTGMRLIEDVHLARDTYSGPYADKAPDITFLPSDMRFKALGTVDFTSNRFIEPVYGNYGDHRLSGILLARGPSFRKGAAITGARLIDIAPTALYIMDEEIPTDMDGRVLEGMLDEGLTKGRKSRYVEAGCQDGAGSGVRYDDTESEEIKKRLIDLGYMG